MNTLGKKNTLINREETWDKQENGCSFTLWKPLWIRDEICYPYQTCFLKTTATRHGALKHTSLHQDHWRVPSSYSFLFTLPLSYRPEFWSSNWNFIRMLSLWTVTLQLAVVMLMPWQPQRRHDHHSKKEEGWIKNDFDKILLSWKKKNLSPASITCETKSKPEIDEEGTKNPLVRAYIHIICSSWPHIHIRFLKATIKAFYPCNLTEQHHLVQEWQRTLCSTGNVMNPDRVTRWFNVFQGDSSVTKLPLYLRCKMASVWGGLWQWIICE